MTQKYEGHNTTIFGVVWHIAHHQHRFELHHIPYSNSLCNLPVTTKLDNPQPIPTRVTLSNPSCEGPTGSVCNQEGAPALHSEVPTLRSLPIGQEGSKGIKINPALSIANIDTKYSHDCTIQTPTRLVMCVVSKFFTGDLAIFSFCTLQ